MEIQEKFLHHIWDQRHLLPDLQTVSGKPIRIIYQGQYNTSNGPDFRHAILTINGVSVQGSVEIHQKTSDWLTHQHQEDYVFNETILHVVLEHRGNLLYTIREDAQQIEILELKDQIDTDIAKLFERYSQNPPVHNEGVCDFFRLISSNQVPHLLAKHGWDRFIRKCNRFNAELHFNSFDQLLYQGFMEAMGYDKNKFNTLSIAQHYTLSTLSEWKQSGLNVMTLASIWLNYSGLLDRTPKFIIEETRINLYQAFEYQSFSTDKGHLKWNLFRIRPANHPVKRIMQASCIVFSILDSGFLQSVLNLLENVEKIDAKVYIAALKKTFHPNSCNSLNTDALSYKMLILISGNIIIPILNLYAQKTNHTSLLQKTKDLYTQFPPIENNYIINFMNRYIDSSYVKAINRSFICQQGMMNLYYRFCNYRLCDLCKAEKQKLMLNL